MAYIHILCTPVRTQPDTPPPPASQHQDNTAGGKRTLAQELETFGGGGGQRQHPRSSATNSLPAEEALTRVPVQGVGLFTQVTHWEGVSLRCQLLTSPLGPRGAAPLELQR